MSERGPEDTAPIAPPRSLGRTQEAQPNPAAVPAGNAASPPGSTAQAAPVLAPVRDGKVAAGTAQPATRADDAPTGSSAAPTSSGPASAPPSSAAASPAAAPATAPPSGDASSEATTREAPAPTFTLPFVAAKPQPVTLSESQRTGMVHPSPAPSTGARSTQSRRARLRLTRLDPWSVMKMSFLLSIAFGIATVVAVAIIWSVLNSAGVWDSVNASIAGVLGGDTASTFDVQDYVGMRRVVGLATLIACADVVLITAIATLSAFLYNLAAALLGGLEVTLADD